MPGNDLQAGTVQEFFSILQVIRRDQDQAAGARAGGAQLPVIVCQLQDVLVLFSGYGPFSTL